jgi:uncharacterized membrane protein YjfL (UPF0719 family)
MLELVGQTLAYSAVGLVILVAGFIVVDLLTPGKLGQLIADRNPNASILAAATLVALGLVMYFAIYFTGAGWGGLDDAIVFGIVGVATQAAGYVVMEMLMPGRFQNFEEDPNLHPQAFVAGASQIAIALIVCASLT